jgi:hypothetical protein
MPNPIKYTTGSETNALKKGNFYIGTGDVGKGPSDTTGYYQGPNVPSGGYVIYLNKEGAPGGLSYHSAANDSELISFTNNLSDTSFTSATQCLNYYATQTDKVCVNRDYEGIVTNGLVLNLDAGFTPSYPKSGTTWYDISGSNNGTLTNGPTFNSDNGGSIVFDGTNDYINVSNPQTLNPGTNSFTIDCWLKQNDLGFNGIVEARGISLHGFLFILNFPSAGLASFFLNTTNDISQNIYTSSTNGFTSTTTWINATVVVNRVSEIIKFYNNGIQQGSDISITSGGTVDPGRGYRYEIGADRGGPEMNGNIAALKQYNRVLTPAEVTQNYNATKGRFGL